MKNILDLNNKENQFKLLFFLLGICIVGLGINMSIVANLGVGAWDTVNIGVSNYLGLSLGICMNIVAVGHILLGAFLRKEKPNFLSLITSVFLGLFVDLWGVAFTNIILNSLYLKIIFFLLSIIIISLGIGLYLTSKLPPMPLDHIVLGLKFRFNTSMMVAKTGGEIIGVCLGLLVGGPVGFGTIVMMFLFGPVIQFFLNLCTNFYDKLVATPSTEELV